MIPTLPGDIPGLLRRGSPVCSEDGTGRGVVFGLPGYDAGRPHLYGINWLHVIHTASVPPCLDLSDPTGRAHAAWWVEERMASAVMGGLFSLADSMGREVIDAVRLGAGGGDMHAKGIGALRRVVLHLAGRTP